MEREAPACANQLIQDTMASRCLKQENPIRFWGIFLALCFLSLISALDVSIVATALPTITAKIGGTALYIWIVNSFTIGSTVLQPLYGQLADTLGRRRPLIASVVLFAVGSGIAGGAINPAMLIAGRSIQGLGAGGIYVLIDIVSCDLVPPRERGKYLGLLLSWSGIGAAIGPVLGGAIAQRDWRWIFYLNIPICGVALAAILAFHKDGTSFSFKERRPSVWKLDYLGAFLFVPSLVAVLFGLITGGIVYPWSSFRVILPLVLGFLGWATFHVQQMYASIPSVPPKLFNNRTSAAGFFLAFLSAVLPQVIIYFLPVYFQAVKGVDVQISGVYFLTFTIGTIISAAIAGILMTKLGTYRALHASGFALSTVGFGILTLLGGQPTTVKWVFLVLISSIGPGITTTIILPAILAALPESAAAAATATYAFLRSFGYVWGTSIPSIIFNAVVNRNLYLIDNSSLQDRLRDGGAYSFSSQAHSAKDTFPIMVWDQALRVYVLGLNSIWYFGLGFSILGFVVVWIEKNLVLKDGLNTEHDNQEKITSVGKP
ncbi:MFS general substrate transporter [Xylaria venustula]|nr:MFS general substrate transporter [Xylaria venustula]